MPVRARRPRLETWALPETVRNETATVAPGDVGYWLLLVDEEVELMAKGVCPADVAKRAWEMLGWKREHYRLEARASEQDGKST